MLFQLSFQAILELVILWVRNIFSRPFETRLRDFAAQFCRPQRETTFGTQGSRWWSIQVNIWKTIHTTWVRIPGSGLNFFQALILQVVCITTMINQIFIFIPSYLFPFLYLFLPLYGRLSFKLLFPLFLFFNTAYFIYRNLVSTLFSGKEITSTDCCSL